MDVEKIISGIVVSVFLVLVSYKALADQAPPAPAFKILPNGDVLMNQEQAQYLARRLEEMSMIANEALAQRDAAFEQMKRQNDAVEKRHAQCS